MELKIEVELRDVKMEVETKRDGHLERAAFVCVCVRLFVFVCVCVRVEL